MKNWPAKQEKEKLSDYREIRIIMNKFINFMEIEKHPTAIAWSRMGELSILRKHQGGVRAWHEDLITGMREQLGNICEEQGFREIQQEQPHKAEENHSSEKRAKKRETEAIERIKSFGRRGQVGVRPEYFKEKEYERLNKISGKHLKKLRYRKEEESKAEEC